MPPQTDPESSATIVDFLAFDLRVGTVVSAEPFPEARKPAFKLSIDFGGSIGVRRSSAQVTELYDLQTLVGLQVVAVVNLPPRQIGPFMSEVFVLGLPGAGQAGKQGVVLLTPQRPVPDGGRVY